jgi:hypothetical protein
MTIKVEVIAWEAKAGQFGVSVQHGAAEAETYFVGTRIEAEGEAKRLQTSAIVLKERPRNPR